MDGVQTRQYGTRPYGVAVVHGGPGAAGHLAPVAARLAAAGRGVLEPLHTATSVNGQAEELRAAIERLAGRPVVVIGHSWGAWLSCLIAAEHPDLVRKLILVGTPPCEERYVPRLRENRMRGLSQAERAEFATLADALNHSAPEQADQYLRRLGELAGRGDTYAPLDSAASPSIPGLSERSGEIYAAVWPEAARMRESGELLRRIGRIACPVLVIHGDVDPHPIEGVVEPLRRLRDFQLVVLERCGHTPWQERYAAEPFYALLEQQLAELSDQSVL